ncbi:MAG: hypothetical protein JO032_04055 [Alphaproteobacteria bacterium]|nr:hypothetical protein [Alphaproteobacteria bacterium]
METKRWRSSGIDLSIDVLFSDVVMPGQLNGAELAVKAKAIRPDLKVLLASGYAASSLKEEHSGFELLPKPFRRDQLAARLRMVIESDWSPVSLDQREYAEWPGGLEPKESC